MRKMNKEISKIDFILATLTVEFLSCGVYNKYYYKAILNEEFTLKLMLVMMILTALLALFVLMRSNICRSINMSLACGILPAVIVMYAAYFTEFKFQIVSTWLICALSILRTGAGLRRASNMPPAAKKMIMIRYSVLLISAMGLVAFIFITM